MDPLALSSPITSPRRCRRHQEARPIPTLARAAATCTYSRHARGRVRPRADAHRCVITPGLSEADIQAVEDRYGLKRTGTVRSVPVLHLVQAAGDPSGWSRLPRTPRSPSRTGGPVLREVVEARRVAHRHALDEVADVVGAGRRGRCGAAAGRRWRCRWTQGRPRCGPRGPSRHHNRYLVIGEHLRGHWPARDRDRSTRKS